VRIDYTLGYTVDASPIAHNLALLLVVFPLPGSQPVVQTMRNDEAFDAMGALQFEK
jgi:hypothetical protein